MIMESRKEENLDSRFDFKTMIPLAVATSIDALAIGVTFAFLNVNIFFSNIYNRLYDVCIIYDWIKSW